MDIVCIEGTQPREHSRQEKRQRNHTTIDRAVTLRIATLQNIASLRLRHHTLPTIIKNLPPNLPTTSRKKGQAEQ